MREEARGVKMTFVRERRHQQPLRLSLPPTIPAADFRHQIHLPSFSLTISPDSPNIEKLSDLEKLAVLGHGNSGTVYKVRHKRSSSIFALKTLRFDRNSTIIRQQAGREAEILRRVDSPYVVQCHAVFDSEDDLYFAMEHMERGSLHDVLLCFEKKMETLRASGSDDVNQEEMRACHEDDAGFAQELSSKYGVSDLLIKGFPKDFSFTKLIIKLRLVTD
ncbi:PREDICTED: mitogen-activated protein kinase kinase 10 [Populus euphratica]|uniref:mitogen-activated protein kinase kinase n=1 Tax=Populus euphratica TaxID=75702 RepID=A0AAJ6XHC2_POPEU|nr:PREDICTED: mitogen-activated protein kinase kinase 10 [Populus euphratica]